MRTIKLLGMAISLVSALVGCAPTLTLDGGRVVFRDARFSAESPPYDWEVFKQPGSVVAWRNNTTKSVIGVWARQLSGLSYPAIAEMVFSSLQIVLRDKFSKSSVTLQEQGEIERDGKKFYRLVVSHDTSPTEGVQVKGKTIAYFLKGKTFEYVCPVLNCGAGFLRERPLRRGKGREQLHAVRLNPWERGQATSWPNSYEAPGCQGQKTPLTKRRSP